MYLIFIPNRDLRQEVLFLVIFAWNAAAIIIGERDVEEEFSSDLGLKPNVAVDNEIIEIEHRRLIEKGVQQREILGKFLLDFGAD